MIRAHAAIALGAALLCAPSANAQTGGLQVSPVIIDIPAARGLSSFRLRNRRDREAAFEIDVFAWSQANGENVLTPSADLIVAPSVFLVRAGVEQIVRLGVAPPARGGNVELSYRIVVRELPTGAAPQGGPRLLLEMSMPVFVRPRGAQGNLRVTTAHDERGAPTVVLANTGNAHLKLSEAPGAPFSDLPRYLLAGARAVRPIADRQRTIRVQVADSERPVPQQLSFDLDDAPALAGLR